MRQRRPVLTCAGAVRNSLRQRAQHAGLGAAALALSGLCLVGSEFVSVFSFKRQPGLKALTQSWLEHLQVL